MARVLMVAYSCEPGESSEGAVGWQLASRIARRHSVTLLTRPRAKDNIEREIALDQSMDLAVEYYEMTGLRRLKYLGLPVSNLRYLAWNHRVGRRVEELAARYDLVHHTTWVRYWMPSAAGRSRGVPFVWGPVGAVEKSPLGLIPTLGPRATAREISRFLGPYVMAADPLMRQTWAGVDHAVAASVETRRWAEKRGYAVSLVPSVGVASEDLVKAADEEKEFDFLSVGRLLDLKGFHLGLAAFAQMNPDLRYLIVGDGPAKNRLKRMAARLGVADRVLFTGHLPREEVLARMATSRVLVHPSLHDSGGFVVAEAMALGVPAVVLDIGGPPFLASDGGVAINPRPSRTLVTRLSVGMEDALLARESYRGKALSRAKSLDWESIVDEYDRIYASVLGSTHAPQS